MADDLTPEQQAALAAYQDASARLLEVGMPPHVDPVLRAHLRHAYPPRSPYKKPEGATKFIEMAGIGKLWFSPK